MADTALRYRVEVAPGAVKAALEALEAIDPDADLGVITPELVKLVKRFCESVTFVRVDESE